jgi:hypothetical protein
VQYRGSLYFKCRQAVNRRSRTNYVQHSEIMVKKRHSRKKAKSVQNTTRRNEDVVSGWRNKISVSVSVSLSEINLDRQGWVDKTC